MNKKRQNIIALLGILSIGLIITGVSLAFFNYTRTGSTDNTITSGSITFIYDEETAKGRGITLTDAMPVSNNMGKSDPTNVFNFRITSNPGNTNIKYTITARKVSDGNKFDDVVDFYLTDQSNQGDYIKTQYSSSVKDYLTFDDLTGYKNSSIEKVLYEKTITSSDLTNGKYEQDFRLRMWIDENTDFSDETYNNQIFRIIVNVNANVDTTVVPSGNNGGNSGSGSGNEQSQTYSMTLTDNDNNGIPSIAKTGNTITSRDEICYGPECFYVLDNDGTNITLLAKYNLKVGNTITFNSKTTAVSQPMNPQTVSGYGMQDDNVKGVDINLNNNNQEYPHTYYGTVAFASSNYWVNDDYNTSNYFFKPKYVLNDPTDIYADGTDATTNIYDATYKTNTIPTYTNGNEYLQYTSISALPYIDTNYDSNTALYSAKTAADANYSIANYVEDYVDFLENTIGVNVVSQRLVLFSDMSNGDCDDSNQNSSVCQIFYDRSYWLGVASSNEGYVVGINYGTGTVDEQNFYEGYLSGVRPVIVVSANNYNLSN